MSRMAYIASLLIHHDRLFLQFRDGRLAGWKGDWGHNWMWHHPGRALARTRNLVIPGSTPRRVSRNDEVLRTSSEPPLPDQHGIAGADRSAERHHGAHRTGIAGVRQRHPVAQRARREAAGDRYRALDAHIGHVGILAGGRDFAEDEEGPV